MCLLQINRKNKECLHCGKGAAAYCEKCYQDLITKNLRLQGRINELETLLFLYREKDSIKNHVPRID